MEELVAAVLQGMTAAGFFAVFFGRARGCVLAWTGSAAIFLLAAWLPGLQQHALIFSALWLMGAGHFCRAGGRQELFLGGGIWLIVSSLARIGPDGVPLQTTAAAALLAMAALYLLGRGELYPLWMGMLVCLWMLAGFFGSMSYGEAWQNWLMKAAVCLVLGGILAFQQTCCIRKELKRRHWTEASAESPGRYGSVEKERIRAWGPGAGTEGKKEAERWKDAAEREYRRLRIFEHDFRHHLDMVGALYEAGSAAEARAYLDDLKQARVSRQGHKMGGEKEVSYIMMAKQEACRRAEIQFSYQILGSPHGIAQMDMTALLLNLLDNAVRACQKAPKPRSIGIMLLARGDLWQIELVNTGLFEPEEQQGKNEVHGIGLVSVRQIVEKYQGLFEIRQEGNTVVQKLILTGQLPE